MKTSTLMTMVLLSASCFAAPAHTARDVNEATAVEPAGALPAATDDSAQQQQQQPQHWQTIALPKSHHLSHSFAGPDEHLQT